MYWDNYYNYKGIKSTSFYWKTINFKQQNFQTLSTFFLFHLPVHPSQAERSQRSLRENTNDKAVKRPQVIPEKREGYTDKEKA